MRGVVVERLSGNSGLFVAVGVERGHEKCDVLAAHAHPSSMSVSRIRSRSVTVISRPFLALLIPLHCSLPYYNDILVCRAQQ
jgi:hypothetical protein